MGLTLAGALRLSSDACIAFVGAGGKTMAIFHLAREIASPVIVTATTHLGDWQIPFADQHLIATSVEELVEAQFRGVTLVTGPIGADHRTGGIEKHVAAWLYAEANKQHIPLLVEADGARRSSLNAPGEEEPPIPHFVNGVVVVAGLSGLGKPLSQETVHHPEIFSQLSGLKIGHVITAEAIVQVLCHPDGGNKNIPWAARRTVLLNQCDTPELQAAAHGMIPFAAFSFRSSSN